MNRILTRRKQTNGYFILRTSVFDGSSKRNCGYRSASIRVVTEFANHWINVYKVNKLKRRRVSCKTCRHSESNDHKISHSQSRMFVCRVHGFQCLIPPIALTIRSFWLRMILFSLLLLLFVSLSLVLCFCLFCLLFFLHKFHVRKLIVSHFYK